MEIIVEGKSDFRFIHFLTNMSKKQIIDSRGIGNAFNIFKKKSKKDEEAALMVDEDPGKSHPKGWNDKQKCNNKELLEDMQKMLLRIFLLYGLRLISLSPDLEEWILYVAQRNKIKPQDYNLSDDSSGLYDDFLDDSKYKQECCERFVVDLKSSQQFSWLNKLLFGDF